MIVVALLAPARTLLGQTDSPVVSRPAEIRTEATAERQVRPDLAIVTFSFYAEGGDSREAGQRLAARADSLRRAFEALGVPRDSLISGSRWYWWRGRIQILGRDGRDLSGVPTMPANATYRANDAIELHLRNLSRIGAAIDSALAHGVTDISPVAFFASDKTAATDAALREATQRARRAAEIIASSGGGRLGRTLSLSTSPDPDHSYRDSGLYAMGGGTGGGGTNNWGRASTEVIIPQVPVSVTIYGRWELISVP